MPASRVKAELARILVEQGYIDAWTVTAATDAPGNVLEIRLRYDDARRSAISGLRRVSRPGPARLRRRAPHPARAGRHGDGDRLDLERRDDRPRGPRSGRRRRGRRGGVVNVAHRASADPGPERRRDHDRAGARARQRPARRARRSGSRATSTSSREEDRLLVTRPTDRGEHRALHGLVRTLVANMVIGVTDGYEKRLEIQGVGYRAQLRGRDLELALGYSHPVSGRGARGHRVRGAAADARRRARQLQAAGRRDRRLHPQAAPAGALQGQGHPLRGRGRRPQGRVSAHDRHHPRGAAPAPPPSRPREGLRHGRATPHLRLPLQPRHLRPADRRRRRPHARRRQLDRGRAARAAARRARRARRRCCSPSAPRPPASRARSSTAAATTTTARSRRSRRERGRAGCAF